MLLTIDIGNSNITCGIFDTQSLQKEWRIVTQKHQTQEWFIEKISDEISEATISSVIIGSVVPELDSIFESISHKLFGVSPLIVSTKNKSNIPNLSQKDTKLGADRLADCVAGVDHYPGNKIIVDVGTATKFEVLSDNNEYLGGAISPGIGISFDALLQKASKLNDIFLSHPKKVVGSFDTKEHLDSGFVYGIASLIDGMVQRIKTEQSWKNPTVILTGGFTDLVSPHLQTNISVNKTLTLEGLRILWEMNQ